MLIFSSTPILLTPILPFFLISHILLSSFSPLFLPIYFAPFFLFINPLSSYSFSLYSPLLGLLSCVSLASYSSLFNPLCSCSSFVNSSFLMIFLFLLLFHSIPLLTVIFFPSMHSPRFLDSHFFSLNTAS